MTQDRNAHQQLIREYLVKMQRDPESIVEYHLLQEGISGASTFQIRFFDEDAILKITRSKKGNADFERAQRELFFYRDLAEYIPLRIPRMIALHSDSHSVALLLAAYQPSLPPASWLKEEYLEAVRQLGRFHAIFWEKMDQLSRFSWLRKPHRQMLTEHMRAAFDYWQALRLQPAFRDILTEQEYQRLHGLVSSMPTVDKIIQLLPMTLCHGNCEPSNVLRDSDGNFIWADWQEVGPGRGPEDISFFLQQSSIAEGAPPYEEALVAYHECLEVGTGHTIPLSTIYRVVDAVALWVDVLYWPAYLGQASSHQLVNLLHRIHSLADQIGIAP